MFLNANYIFYEKQVDSDTIIQQSMPFLKSLKKLNKRVTQVNMPVGYFLIYRKHSI